MKLWLSIFGTILVLFCVSGITSLTAAGDVVPAILPTVALGAFAGSYALLSVPTVGDLAVALIIIAAIVVLSLLHDAIPISLSELLVVALAGHFALTLPDPPAAVSTTPLARTIAGAGTAAVPPPAASAPAPMIGGQ